MHRLVSFAQILLVPESIDAREMKLDLYKSWNNLTSC